MDKPTQITFFEGIGQKVVKLVAAGDHSAAITDQGQVFVWGSNASGQLAAGEDVKTLTTPKPLDDHIYSRVWLGNSTLMVQNATGYLRVAGMKLWPSLSPLETPKAVKDAVCGHDYYAALLEDGSFLHFNAAYGQQKPAGSLSGSIELTEAEFLKGEVQDLAGAYNYSAAIVA